MADYNETFDAFWADIVLNSDGTVNLDQVKRELHDFKTLMDNVGTVYDELTMGAITKVMADPQVVISEVHARQMKEIDEAVEEATKE